LIFGASSPLHKKLVLIVIGVELLMSEKCKVEARVKARILMRKKCLPDLETGGYILLPARYLGVHALRESCSKVGKVLYLHWRTQLWGIVAIGKSFIYLVDNDDGDLFCNTCLVSKEKGSLLGVIAKKSKMTSATGMWVTQAPPTSTSKEQEQEQELSRTSKFPKQQWTNQLVLATSEVRTVKCALPDQPSTIMNTTCRHGLG
jgi:hypothetical protein